MKYWVEYCIECEGLLAHMLVELLEKLERPFFTVCYPPFEGHTKCRLYFTSSLTVDDMDKTYLIIQLCRHIGFALHTQEEELGDYE